VLGAPGCQAGARRGDAVSPHILHSVVPTRSEQPRIAVPFDLNLVAARPAAARSRQVFQWSAQQGNYKQNWSYKAGVQS
jgi:hypothetical protein